MHGILKFTMTELHVFYHSFEYSLFYYFIICNNKYPINKKRREDVQKKKNNSYRNIQYPNIILIENASI